MLSFESVYTRKVGGLAEVPPRLSEALSRRGVDVEVYTPSHGLSRTTSLGGEVYRIVVGGEEYSIREYNAPVKHYVVTGGVLEEQVVYSWNLHVKSLIFARVMREYYVHRALRGEAPRVVHGHDWHSFPALLAINAESTERNFPTTIFYHIHLLSHESMRLQDLTSIVGLQESNNIRGSLGVRSLREYYELSGGWIEKLAALTSDKVLTVSRGYAQDIVKTLGLSSEEKVDYVFNALTLTWNEVLEVASKIIGERDPFEYETRRLVREKLLRELWPAIRVENPDPEANSIVNKLLGEYKVSFREPFKRDGPLILLVGRATRQKGVDFLLKSMDKLTAEIPDARVVLAVIPLPGVRDLLEDAIKSMLLFPDNLRVLPGYVGREHLLLLYYAASALLAPSRYEPFGLVVLESMVSGTPVVASNTGGFRDLVLDVRKHGVSGTGALFTPLDREDMINALKNVVGVIEAGGVISAKLRRRCVDFAKEFTWDKSAEKLVGLYGFK